MPPELQTAVNQVLSTILLAIATALGLYLPKVIKLVLAYLEARAEALLVQTKVVSQEQAHQWLIMLCEIADKQGDRYAIGGDGKGAKRATWVYKQAVALHIPVTEVQVQAAYNRYVATYRRADAAGTAVPAASGQATLGGTPPTGVCLNAPTPGGVQ